MVFDPEVVSRVRSRLEGLNAITEEPRFGGWGFRWFGEDILCVSGADLMVRLGDDAPAVQGEPGIRPFNPSGTVMADWAVVQGPGLDDDALTRWVSAALQRAVGD